MQIVINHLTRMQRGYVCVAGLDTDIMAHIRPVYAGGRLTDTLLARHGGSLDMGVVLDLGKPRYVGHPPELEDYHPDWLYVRAVRRVTGTDFWKMLQAVARTNLNAIFGPDLIKRGPTAAIDPNGGSASLGCITCEKPPSLRLIARPPKPDQLRLTVTDPSLGFLDLPVTDIRLYGPDHLTPDRKTIARVSDRLRHREAVILAVGVGRPFPPPPAADSAHWLQVNNIHFADEPVWQLG